MGNTCSNVGPVTADKSTRAHQEEVNRSIEKDLLAEKKKKVLKLLLLGPGDSGKSTTLKQIRIIHDQGFTDDEKRQRKYIVYLNLISGMIEVIRGMSILSLSYKNANSEELAKKITKYYDEVKNSDAAELTEVVADSIGRLLEDPSVQEVLRQSSELSIEESSTYFLRELPRIRENDYLPSLEDILKSRVSTSGVYQFTFLIKNFTFKVFDVGGQKAQRRKWIHIFDDVHAVLFITSLSEYNQVLAEDNKTNRMRDSIELFDQICNNEWFSNTAMILFLNKIDLFAEKIKKFNITCALKNYRGAQEYRPALDYITKKFRQVNKNSKRNIYTHETCATDTMQIEVVIDSVIDVVIQQTMQKVGIQ
ncbi:guanine nucleotide-binding protein alpha-8 subunit family protein [Ancylostoma caninum]|uniref:Guanine nucleotide-binding protein alpha-8 subunit family protein n=1 Tax=Ancylostoma caninum TaxID=29170 RepID=A0A368FKR6_ANCCA|nr:guanine nucleotide-binding protein alpha-8 subunit family protein [Ancylostoma caninum]